MTASARSAAPGWLKVEHEPISELLPRNAVALAGASTDERFDGLQAGELRDEKMEQVMGTFREGFRRAPAAERAGLAILSSAGVTIGISRAVNYARERRRPLPRLRSLGRRIYHAPGGRELRIHHFLPGMLISAVAGATSILTHGEGYELWLGIPFGVGSGLTLDEVALLVDIDNAYWGSEKVVLLASATAMAGAAALGVRSFRRGMEVYRVP